MTPHDNAEKRMSRRQVATGVAWALPAITIASAAPSLAASPTAPSITAGWADKCPGASDVPTGWPKHGYRVVLTISGDPEAVTPVSVLLGNGKWAQILGDATPTSPGTWEFVVDAKSSPRHLTVTVLIDGTEHVTRITASPRCTS